jgi:hypothetical protein
MTTKALAPRCPFEHLTDPDAEARQIADTARLTASLLDKRYPPPAPIRRSVHPKSHGCVRATFTIRPDIAAQFQVGLFAEPGRRFDAIVRFSNAAALGGPDVDCSGRHATPATPDKHGSRGMAIKVMDVGDDVLAMDGAACNQDFLMINQPMFAFANVADYSRLNAVLERNQDDPTPFFAPLRANDPALPATAREAIHKDIEAQRLGPDDLKRIATTFGIIRAIQATPAAHPLGIQYFSAAPFLFGADRVMKFSVRPCAAVAPDAVPQTPPDNYLREALAHTMKTAGTLQFDFLVQVRDGSDDLGIENACSVWDEAAHPFDAVATLTIVAPQDIDDPEREAWSERLVFTPWHSLAAHQPIGGINRLRQAVYEASAEQRLKQRAHSPSP